MWGIVRRKVAGGIPAPIFEHSMQRMMPGFRDYSASFNENTRGLLDMYGPTRVVDTPITKTGFAGPGIGSTYHGLGSFMTFKSSMQGMGAANSNMKSVGWISEGSHYRDGQKTIGSAKRGIRGMLLDTEKAPIGVSLMPTRIEAVIPMGAQFPRVGKTVTIGNKRYFGTVSESASQKQSSQTEEKLNGCLLSWVVFFLTILPLGAYYIWKQIVLHEILKEVVKHNASGGCPIYMSISWLGEVKVSPGFGAAPKNHK